MEHLLHAKHWARGMGGDMVMSRGLPCLLEHHKLQEKVNEYPQKETSY